MARAFPCAGICLVFVVLGCGRAHDFELDAAALDAGALDSAAEDDAEGALDAGTSDDAGPPVDDAAPDAGPIDGGPTALADALVPVDARVTGASCAACARDRDCASGPCTCGVCGAFGETCANGLDDDCDAAVDEGCGICGDGIVELGETCDPPSSCPTSCPDDGNPCTAEYLVDGSRACYGWCERLVLRDFECDDGLYCNGPDRCERGTCRHLGSPCGAAGATCDEASDRCSPCDSIGLEFCNGLDDDCDGTADEPPTCSWDTPYPETCNNIDDDLNGRIDDIRPTACGTDVGACERGVSTCACGAFRCVGSRGSRPETCAGDGLDEDCDGVTDEGCPALP